MKKLLLILSLIFFAVLPAKADLNENLKPLISLPYKSIGDMSEMLARCGAIQLVNLRLDLNKTASDKKFSDSKTFMTANSKVLQAVYPNKTGRDIGLDTIKFQQFYIEKYNQEINKGLIAADRTYCDERLDWVKNKKWEDILK